MIALDHNSEKYLHLYADCIPVKGAARSAIYDLTRNQIIFFQSKLYDVLRYFTSDKVGVVLNNLKSEKTKNLIIEFINFLDQYETIGFVDDPSIFPAIAERWELPSIIQNAIIDVDHIVHDFSKIFSDLDVLGCPHVQIRCFSHLLNIDQLYSLLELAKHKSIESIELILKYDENISDETYIKFIEDHPMVVSTTIHSSPMARTLEIKFGCDDYLKAISFVEQNITSQLHCGMITPKHLNAPTVANFFETKLYNGCLNRKIAIDTSGAIKNCPSMSESYGNIQHTHLMDILNIAEFKAKWLISKDQIETCKDCELRYACSDCRAYLEKPQDLYSKPLKCGYDPYSGQWEEWSQNPLKAKAIEYYGL
jgi:SPASM domain peptide maturase of grasp-with-spasm system